MKTTILTFAVIFLSLLSAPTSAQYYSENQAEHDTLAKILQHAVDNNLPITGELLEIALAVAGDNVIKMTLKEGHKEYVSMPTKYPNGLMSSMLIDLNHLKQSSTNSTSNADQLIELDKKVNDLTTR